MPLRTPSRRALLLGGAGALALSAGCISDLESESESPSDTDDDSDADDASNGTDGEEDESTDGTTGETDDGLEYETRSYRRPETPTEPTVTLLGDRDEAENWLADRGLEDDAAGESETDDQEGEDEDDEPDAEFDDTVTLSEFVVDTLFEDASLIALEANAPTLCYELVLEDIAFEPDDGNDGDETETESEHRDHAAGTLELEAAVRDESDDNEVCGQAMTTVGLLVRASVSGAPVGAVSVRLVDDDGSEHELHGATASRTDESDAADN